MNDDNKLYSRIYHAPPDPLADSTRFRTRLAGSYSSFEKVIPRTEFARFIKSELGVEVPVLANFGYWPDSFFSSTPKSETC